MFFEEIEAKAKGTKAFKAWTYYLARSKVKLWQKWWGPKWEERDQTLGGKAPSESESGRPK
jgi:hypothetical protein